MSYRALYRTYRPKDFSEVVGQDHIVSTLQNVIGSDKIRHAYLFAGPRGTGKTSVAHVFARAINKTASGNIVVDDLDIIEIDAASNNGVADVRTIIESSSYAPTKAKYKIYIIDEVHMLTKGAFNALLKTLEEPPKHIVFILATTEAHKIPTTILSRVQRFNFRRIDNETIKKQLRNVLHQEKIAYDEESIKFIADLSQGGMRDALTISDQAAAFGNGSISFETIAQVFGVVSSSNQIKIINCAYEGKTKELMRLINGLIDNGADIERVSLSLLGIVKDFIVYSKTQDTSLLENISFEEFKSLAITVNYAYEVVEILMKLISDLRFTEVPKQSFELAILKMARSRDAAPIMNQPNASDEDIFKTDTFVTPISKPIEAVVPESVPEPVIKKLMEEEESLFDIVSDRLQEETQSFAITEDVISTTEFLTSEQISSVAEETEVEEPVQEQPTISLATNQEISLDLLKLFEIDHTNTATQTIERASKHSNEDILNAFLLSSRDTLGKVKPLWTNLVSKGSSPKLLPLASLLSETRIAAAGDNFVVVVAESQSTADELFKDYETQEMIELSKNIFGIPLYTIAISKAQFDEVKLLWQTLQAQGSLPNPTAIQRPTMAPKAKTEAEALGTSIFGDLFKN